MVLLLPAEDGIRDLIVTGVQTCFLSSRRRHTRSDRDWSSDVCSSDLLLERVILLQPHYLEAHRLLGIVRFHAGQPSEALEPLKTATEVNPKDDEATFYLGLCYLALDRDDEASKALERLAADAPADADDVYWH